MKAILSRVRHPSHPGWGHGSLTCHMTQFERSDWLRSENLNQHHDRIAHQQAVSSAMNRSRRFRDCLTSPILHKLTYIYEVGNNQTPSMVQRSSLGNDFNCRSETPRLKLSNVIFAINEHTSITNTLKHMFCGVPSSDLSRNMDIYDQVVLTWTWWICDANPCSWQK